MLEKLKPIKTTPTGIYFRMADGRIGYANHQYARVSVAREGIRNGKYYKEDCEIGDRAYQINKVIINQGKWGNEKVRVRYNNISEAINALNDYNAKNCNEAAVDRRKQLMLKSYEEHQSDYRVRKEARIEADAYAQGFCDGVSSIENKLVKLLNNL